MKSNLRQRTLILTLLLAAILLLAACGAQAPEPTPTEAPAVETPELPATGADLAWDRIQKAGRLVVGTSADYPPFSYYDDNFRVVGFDPALIRQIGDQLGLEVDIKDFAFDGLGGALQLGQIDVAIAAISVTPERRAYVDFSNVYLVTEDAVLAAEDSKIGDIRAVEDMAGRRIGVQRGSVYEDWLNDALVDTGLMRESNLFLYTDIGPAIRDLQDGRVDLVVLDLQPAEVFTEEAAVRVVASGLNRQRLAMALPLGEPQLLRQINAALTTLQDDNVVADLAQEYLGIGEDELLPIPPPVPTPTPPPNATATPVPPQPCIDGMAWVQDLSYNDQNMTAPPVVQPGQPFRKGWRVRNVGTCAWDSSYSLNFVQGNQPGAQMNGQPVAVQGIVQPGQTYDFWVDLVAPVAPGTYQAFWQMRNGNGASFGQRIWVGITVPASATPTPRPTQTPSPDISFSANTTNITAGQCVIFSWNVNNVQAVYFYAQGQNWQNNGVAGQGSSTQCPTQTTTYYLRVVKPDNSVETREITIYVTPSVDAPVISKFTLTPPNSISVGQCVQLEWKVGGNVSRVVLTRNNVSLWDGAPVRGTYQDCPPGTGSMTYTLQATGPGGVSQSVQTLQVVAQPQPTPVPPTNTPAPPTATSVPPTNTPAPPTETPVPPTNTPAPQPPVIDSFSVNPQQIAPGQCVDVAWSTGGGTTQVVIKRNDVILIPNAPLTGNGQDCLDSPGTYTYRLEADNATGQTDFRDQQVSVQEAAPTNTPEPETPPFVGANWAATQVQGTTVLEGTSITAVFDASGGLSGSSGCNTYSASYSVSGSSLSITPPAGTNQFCDQPEGVMDQESAYLNTLPSVAGYFMEAGQLYLTDANGNVQVEYVRRDR